MATAEWRVLIADDEPAARRGVRQMLAPYTDFRVAGECSDGAETLAALDALSPHVLFLDVQMPGLGGFDVIHRRAGLRMPILVFLTAHDQFAVRAFDAEALDYLLKPVTQARFAVAMSRVGRALETAADGRQEAITVTTARGAVVLPISEIDWIESADNYARIWTAGRSYLLRESMHALQTRAAAHGFVRAHRRALVRLAAVRELVAGGGDVAVAVLACGARVPVSRRRRAQFAAAIRARR